MDLPLFRDFSIGLGNSLYTLLTYWTIYISNIQEALLPILLRQNWASCARKPWGHLQGCHGERKEARALPSKEPEKALILLVIDYIKVPLKSINKLKKKLPKAINEEDNVIILNLKHGRKHHCRRDCSQFQMCFKLDAFMRLDHLKMPSLPSALKAFANSSSSLAWITSNLPFFLNS